METLHVERLGGLANFGGANSRVRSRGQINAAALPPEDLKALNALFLARNAPGSTKTRDGFRYRISRSTSQGTDTIEVPESAVPLALTRCVKDELT